MIEDYEACKFIISKALDMDSGYQKAIALKNQIERETSKLSKFRLELIEMEEINLDVLLESRKKRQKTEAGWKIDISYIIVKKTSPVSSFQLKLSN